MHISRSFGGIITGILRTIQFVLLTADCLIQVSAIPLVIKLSDHVSIGNTPVNMLVTIIN